MAGNSITTVKIRDLRFDPRVQRSLDEARVNKIIGDFDRGSVGVITCNERSDGTIYTIDGQHRVVAMRRMGMDNEVIDANLYHHLDLSEEAALFRRLNNTRNVVPVDRFRIRIIEGDEVARNLEALLVERGLHIAPSSNVKGGFAAVTALENIYVGKDRKQRNASAVQRTLKILVESWGREPMAVRAELLSGVAAVIERHGPKVEDDRLIRQLQAVTGGAAGFLGRAKGMRDMRGGRLGDAVAELILVELNKNRKVQHRLGPWR